MTQYAIQPATLDHVIAMTPHVRQADRDEIGAASGKDIATALRESFELSEMCWAGLVDGEVACLFGCGSVTVTSLIGVPWLIGTDLVERHAKAFLRRNRPMVAQMRERWPHLVNWVDVRNTKAIAWLEWLGFTMHDPAPYGVAGRLFRRFELGGS